MGIPTITALYGSIAVGINTFLALRIPALRMKHRVSIGTGASSDLELHVRIHANNAEYTPLFVLMLLLAELCGGASVWLHVSGGLFVVGRILHPIGMPRPAPNAFRALGMVLTWVNLVVLVVWVLYLRSRG